MNPEIEKESNIERLPKVNFKQVDLDREFRMLVNFMQKDERWFPIFIKKYPELQTIHEESRDENERLKRYREFLEKTHLSNHVDLLSAQEKIQSSWEEIGPEFLRTLSEHFETDWPIDKDITGFISILPVFPRFLDDYSFFTGYGDTVKNIETSAHEIVHFLWFKKWKEVFPEIPRKEYESPNLVWRLSEIIDPIILQCHPKIKELVKPKFWGYNSFKDIKIGEVSMIEYFKEIYLKSVNSGDNFETTMRKLWEETQKHEAEISKF